MPRNQRRHTDNASEKANGKSMEVAGLIAVGATALAGAAVLLLLTTRTGREARARLRDADMGRRLHDTVEEIQRLAEHGAAYIERKAAEIRQGLGPHAAALLDARAPRGE
jgi:hypothetical protein